MLRLGVVSIGLLIVLLALPVGAQAYDQSHVIDGVACPASSFCAAFEIGGTYVLTANPTLDSSWRAMNVTEEDAPTTGLSCPSENFCAMVDGVGDVITSTDPSAPEPSWSTAHVDIEAVVNAAKIPVNGLASARIEGISCPSAALCVAVDSDGNVLTSTDPAAGTAAWHREDLDAKHQFDAVSCAPRTTFCAAVDMEGRLFVSGNAAGGTSSWRSAKLPAGASGSNYTNIFWGISCPTAGFCMGLTSQSEVFTSTEPGNPASWRETPNGPLTSAPLSAWVGTSARSTMVAHAAGATSSLAIAGENIISCPSSSFCAAPGFSAHEIWTTSDPTAYAPTWQGAQPPQLGGENTATSVGCATEQFCLAGTWLGEGLVSADPGGYASAWPARLAPAAIPSAPSELHLSHVSLKGTVKPRPARSRLGDSLAVNAHLSFRLAAPYPVHPVSRVELYCVLDKDMTIPGGYHEKFNGFLLTRSKAKLVKSIRVTSHGRRVRFSVRAQASKGLSLYLRRPATPITITLSTPGLKLSPHALRAIEHRRQATVQMLISPWDEVSSDAPNLYPKIKTHLRFVKAKHGRRVKA